MKRLDLKIGLKKLQITLPWHCVGIAIKTFQLAVKGQVKLFLTWKIWNRQNVPQENTSKQSTIKLKEVDPTSESGSSRKKSPEFRMQYQVDSMLHKECALKAKVKWAREILVKSYSFGSSVWKGEIFHSFPLIGWRTRMSGKKLRKFIQTLKQ